MPRLDWTACVGLERIDPPGATRRAMWDIRRAAQRRGRPLQLDPAAQAIQSSRGML